MRKREIKKEQILWAGLELMRELGYNGTSVKDIVDAAEVPKGSFYNYFESKEAFALDALEAVAVADDRMSRELVASIDLPPLERLQAFFNRITDHFCDCEFRQGCFFGNMAQEMSDSNEVIRDKVRQIMQRKTRFITELLEEARDAGEIGSDIELDSLAEFIFNAWEGAIMRMKTSRSREPLDVFVRILPQIVA